MKKKFELISSNETIQDEPKFTREYMDKMGIPYVDIPTKLMHLRHFFKMPVSVPVLGMMLYYQSLESKDFPTFSLNKIPADGFSKYQTINGLKKLLELNILYLHSVKGLADHYTWNFEYLLSYSDEEKDVLRSKGLGRMFEN